jgi:predicted SAM-dependent methyltransferase
MKLHLGCGKKYIQGYTHVDLLDYEHIDYKVSADKLSFAIDNSIELIYACHILEHFGRHEYENVLQEWYRVLKPNGILRLAVPDFDAIVNYYSKNDKNINLFLGLLMGGQKDNYDFHKMIFSYDSLSHSLLKIGFKEVNKYDWKETDHSSMDDYSQSYLPHMDKTNGTLMSLNVEALK